MIKVVDLPATVGAFEATNAAGDTGDTPKGKVGTVVRVEEELTEAGGDLSYLLLPVGQTQQIGAEKQDKKSKGGIERYSNKFGSYRYVMVMDDEPVGAIQVMSRDKTKAVIANVYVKPELRRQGIAKNLLVQARKDFDEVVHSNDLSDDGKGFASAVVESIYKKIVKEKDLSGLHYDDTNKLSRLTQMMMASDACCDTESISGLWSEIDPQYDMSFLLPEPEYREYDEDEDWQYDEEEWTEQEMEKRRIADKGISMEEIYKSREELGRLSQQLLAKDGIATKSPDGSGAVVKVWRCGSTKEIDDTDQPVTSVTWSEKYAYKFCGGKKQYHTRKHDHTDVDAYYVNLKDVLVSIPHVWHNAYDEKELLVRPKDMVSVQGYKRLKEELANVTEVVYNNIIKGL
jgi:predicted GNAT family acetyltransferase